MTTQNWKTCMLTINGYSPIINTVDTRYFDIGYLDVFVKSWILSLYILYTILRISWHFAYLNMFLGPKQCFHVLI